MIHAKKIFPVLGLSLLMLSSTYAAAPQQNSSSGTNMQQTSGANNKNKNSNGVINPAARPILGSGLDFFVDGDLLWWKARETGLDFATKTTFPALPGAGPGTSGQFINSYSGDVKNPHFGWDLGFRVGVGFNMPFDGWDIYLNWVRFHTSYHHGSTTADPAFSKRILPQFQPVNLPDQNISYSSADPSWKLHYDNLDLELGREFFVSRRLTLRPHIGLRASWVHQKYNIRTTSSGSAVFTGNLTRTFTMNTSVRMENEFNGIGPRAGLNTEWRLGRGISVFGDAAVALLLGDFDVTYSGKEDAIFTVIGEVLGTTSLTNRFHSTVTTVDLDLGLRWAYEVGDSFRFRIQLGWESHIYFDQNQFISFEQDTLPETTVNGTANTTPFASSIEANTLRRGDLSMQGLTASVRFDF